MTTADVALKIFTSTIRGGSFPLPDLMALLDRSWDVAEIHKKKEAQHIELKAAK